MKYLDEFRDPGAAAHIVARIAERAAALSAPDSVHIMEVCGSHTMAIARHGIRDVLPDNVDLISGPGCPVCVTDAGYIDTAIRLAERGVIVASFGDLLNVPGSDATLVECRAAGHRIEVCYSPLGAVELARAHPDKEVVFLGIGFETTIAPVVSLVDIAAGQGVENLSVLTAFKLVPPALAALSDDPEIRVDAFLCPAHVSAIIGANAYEAFVARYRVPCVIAGFEPLDILFGLQGILEQVLEGTARVENQYARVVRPEGNPAAQRLMATYLTAVDATWRGIGTIPGSGLALRSEYARYDATCRFDMPVGVGNPDPRCRCGDVLKGKIKPVDCPLFGTACQPRHPVGPCMVSSEGSCSAYYKYSR